ncbi:MAG: YebC/PmpR family DNA-binding transcriptional regulator [Planctomycetota bacterium]|nr:MAG: YebC/PmpR family DNA-binding transcriptional regulator [Planctomycetota bacterium]
MAGHSHWAGIKHKKKLVDAKRGKLFSKLAKKIIVAARHGGGDPTGNSTLALAIEKAKAANMPKDNIRRAIKRGTGELGGSEILELTFEGYGPGGVAIMVEAATDNKNRTLPEIRKIFEKRGGNLGTTGCVRHVFQRRGLIRIDASKAEEDAVLEAVLEAGADDMVKEGDFYDIFTGPTELFKVRKALEEQGLTIESAELSNLPTITVKLDEEVGRRLLVLIEEIEDHDDVQNLYANFDLPESLFAE